MTRASLVTVWLAVVAAFGLWYFIFQTETWNFWLRLSLSAGLLAIGALALTPDSRRLFQCSWRAVVIGVVSALALYALFWAGKGIATALLPFASADISNVYAKREQLDLVQIGLLLFFIVGPSEEVFWRGFVQRRLADLFGDRTGLLAATALYALVHLWTLNVTLIVAAAVVGLFWGWLYGRERNLVAVMISHSLWDLIVFVLLPLGGI
jgi:hypothetical protein